MHKLLLYIYFFKCFFCIYAKNKLFLKHFECLKNSFICVCQVSILVPVTDSFLRRAARLLPSHALVDCSTIYSIEGSLSSFYAPNFNPTLKLGDE